MPIKHCIIFLLTNLFDMPLTACIKDRREAYGDDCFKKGHGSKKLVVIAGKSQKLIFRSILFLSFLLHDHIVNKSWQSLIEAA